MKRPRIFVVLATIALPCCSTGGGQTAQLSAPASMPFVAQRLALDPSVRAVQVWAAPEGGGMVAFDDGNFALVDRTGALSTVPRATGGPVPAGEQMVASISDRGDGDAIAIVPSGALLLASDSVVAAELPDFLAMPTAFAPWGQEALWATAAGLYLSDGASWFRLDAQSGPITGATQLATFEFTPGVRDGWALASGALHRVEYASGTPPTVTWLDPAPGVALGNVRAIAAMGVDEGAIATDSGVTFVSPREIRSWQYPNMSGGPDAIAGGGGYAWLAWNGNLFRTDGDHWTSVVTDMALGVGTHIAVNSGTGTAALVVDSNGALERVVAERTIWLSGVENGAIVTSTTLPLEVLVDDAGPPSQVTFELDGMMVSMRTSAPWGWADDGTASRDLGTLAYGPHTITVTFSQSGSNDLRRSISFVYASPLGRVPTYAMDIAPFFTTHCARCHGHGSVAQDLSTYTLLQQTAATARTEVRQRTMPPDLSIDDASIALFTAWVDGNTPP